MSLKIFTKEYLQEHYVELNKSARQISIENDYRTTASVYRALIHHGFYRKNDKPSHILTKELLLKLYVEQQKSARDIADELNLRSATSVRMALRQFGIPTRTTGVRTPKKLRQYEKQQKGFEEISGSYWCSIRNCAKRRGLLVAVTIQEAWEQFLKQNRRCALSGEELFFAKRSDYLRDCSLHTASLDRINSTLGYLSGNIQWIHKELQWMKCDLPDDKFVDWCEKVAKFKRGE